MEEKQKQEAQDNEWSDVQLDIAPKGEQSEDLLAQDLKRVSDKEETENKEEDETEETVEDDDVEEVTQVEEPESVITVEDPGDFTPNDYSFEVTLASGKTIKVKSPEDAESLADDPENFKTPKDLLLFMRKAQKMENGIERDRERWEAQRDKYEEQRRTEEQKWESVTNIASEINYLVAKGKLPKVPAKYQKADWSDPEVAKQPGVKETRELIDFMTKENEVRMKAGLKPMTSVLDAYNAWVNERNEKKTHETKKQAGEQRKAMGARIGGSSPAPAAAAPKGLMIGRAGSLKDLDQGWGEW